MERLESEALTFAKAQAFSTMATIENGKPWARVMAQARVDDDFSVWYSTFSFSNKVNQIKENDHVCITMNDGRKDIRIFGRAEIFDDRETKHKMWKDEWTRYFKEGKDDPGYVLVKVVAEKVEYRDMEKYGIMPVDIRT
jgi:general stress protein 26